MKKEYDFSRAKRARFQGLPPRDELARRTKVRITIMLDHDVLEHFRTRARVAGAEPYQTQINRALRECMDRGGRGGTDHVLNDEGFISQLAERVARYSAGRRKPADRTGPPHG